MRGRVENIRDLSRNKNMFNTKKKKTFFEKLTGVINEEETPAVYNTPIPPRSHTLGKIQEEEEDDLQEGELACDVYQTNAEIIIQTMAAGVRPEDLNISITQEKVVISGKREAPRGVGEEDYFFKELYWGTFSRTIVLPQEVEAEEAEAMEKHGLLIIRLPKLDKAKLHRLKVKTL